ncbi:MULTISPECIES: hypothetical protein [Streptomyces]|uniref:hypothetical protein n=1 Tax=Streptomyces TaxID=1883 RepID=UPI0007CD92F7|nr:hypothetical protein A4V12_26080 [Streptomyces noursei]
MAHGDEGATPRRRGWFGSIHAWAATAAAVVALAISLYNLAELQQEPTIEVKLPHLMRIGPAGKGTLIYFQPTVSTRHKSQEVEVIGDVRLRLKPTGSISSSQSPKFYWQSNGVPTFDFETDEIRIEWSGDPAPFLVSQDKPQQPMFQFQDDSWALQPGRYEGFIQLSRSGNRKPLTEDFCLIVSKRATAEMRGGGERGIYFFRNDLPKFTSSSKYSSCYVRETD